MTRWAAGLSAMALAVGATLPGVATARVTAPVGLADAPTSYSVAGALRGVAATSRDDTWAVGSTQDSRPLILHRGRGAWSAMSVANPPTGGLNGVAATSATNAWAVGTSGSFSDPMVLVLHWDGVAWTPQYNAGHGRLAGIAAVSDDLAWAVGSTAHGRDLILRWDGTTWQRLHVPFAGELLGVAVRSAHDAWAVGIGHGLAAQILHWDGQTWSRIPVRVPRTAGLEKVLLGVAVAPHGRAWAVGDVRCGCGPGVSLVLHWAHGHWRRVHSPTPHGGTILTGVIAIGARTVWAVGESGSGDGPTRTLILRHGEFRVDASSRPDPRHQSVPPVPGRHVTPQHLGGRTDQVPDQRLSDADRALERSALALSTSASELFLTPRLGSAAAVGYRRHIVRWS